MTRDWFQKLTGLPSDAPEVVRAGVTVEGPFLTFPASGRRLRWGALEMPRLADLAPPESGPRRLRVSEVVADVTALHRDPDNAGAVFQVASQFNLLEMVGPQVSPEQGIARYAFDATQGPACAMACAAGTIWRNYLVPVAGQPGQDTARQLDMLEDFGLAVGNAGGRLWQMRNGYALPRPGGLAEVASQIEAKGAQALRGLIRVGVQRDTEVTAAGAAGHLVTQVYCSALPIAYAGGASPAWEPFARLVLEAAYLATLSIAAETARRGGSNRLYLTRLGGGAFGNPPGWITDAMALALADHAASDLDVRIVSYRHPDPANRPLLGAAPG